jgi:predicted DNA-binding protein
MGVLKPRKKMVSLRLSEDEYERLIALSSIKGAHSASDLARAAVCDFLVSNDDHPGSHGSVAVDLQRKVAKLEAEVRRLSRSVSLAIVAER